MSGRALVGVVALCVATAACSVHTQTTSGAAYLRDYSLADGAPDLDREVRAAAAVEPLLKFPARIGLARIDESGMTPLPPAEAEAWEKLGERLGAAWGEFVPVSPLVARLAASAAGSATGDKRDAYQNRLERTVREIRLGAARQHVDAVLVYEVRGQQSNQMTPLSVADLTLIGAYVLPTRSIHAKGFATALLVDVRNGYPYGFVDPVVEEDSTLRPAVGSDDRAREMGESMKTAAALKLVPEVEKMALKLRAELAEKALRDRGQRRSGEELRR